MELRGLDLPGPAVEHFADRGIDSLYPPQAAAVEAGVLRGENVVAAIPTAAGKTLIAQLAMLSAPGTALYIVPLRALAAEKGRDFRRLPGASVAVATGGHGAPADELGGHDVVVATSEKVDSLIRHGAGWLSEVGCVVVDEVHLVDDPGRGPTLEMTVAKLRRLAEDLQVVALSATVGNADEVADWLDAALVEDDWRPVELRAGVYRDGRIAFDDGSEAAVWTTASSPVPALCEDALAGGGACLVFVNSRRGAEALAADLGGIATGDADLADEAGATARTDTGRALSAAIRDGAAFHHAGLRDEHRVLVEDAFRDRRLSILCATPTLAAGVNVPARRVVVRDHRRYTDEGLRPLSVLEVHQMFGRAGRPGLDPYGEAVLVADSSEEADALNERYLEGEPEPVTSKLATQEALRTHALATAASGFAATREELIGVLDGTFYAAREDPDVLVDIADLVVEDLASMGMIDRSAGLAATELGGLVSRLYVDPRTADRLLAELDAVAEMPEARLSALTFLELICRTPDMSTFYLRGDDHADLYRYAMDNEATLTTEVHDAEGAFDDWLANLKTARVLADWLRGDDEDAITDRHGIGPGDLRVKVERAGWMLGAAESLAAHRGLDPRLIDRVREVREGIEGREA